MRYYVTDSDGRIRGKFDGVDTDLPDEYNRHEVDSISELSDITVDEWDDELI